MNNITQVGLNLFETMPAVTSEAMSWGYMVSESFEPEAYVNEAEKNRYNFMDASQYIKNNVFFGVPKLCVAKKEQVFNEDHTGDNNLYMNDNLSPLNFLQQKQCHSEEDLCIKNSQKELFSDLFVFIRECDVPKDMQKPDNLGKDYEFDIEKKVTEGFKFNQELAIPDTNTN